jgi:osmotically-inducible protein OsmY
VAVAAVGTTGRVLNEVTVKNVDDKSADDLDGRIRSDLKKMVDADPVLRDRSIDFDVNNGVVTVKGDVRTARETQLVTDLVKTVPGVKDMANALEIKPGK